METIGCVVDTSLLYTVSEWEPSSGLKRAIIVLGQGP